jgi:hypothetical protein
MAVMGRSGQAAWVGYAASATMAPMMQAKRRIFLSCPARLLRALLMRRYAVPMRVEGPDLCAA